MEEDSITVSEEKRLSSLWQLYGLNESLSQQIFIAPEDRIECLYLWIDTLYGGGAAAAWGTKTKLQRDVVETRKAKHKLAGKSDISAVFVDPIDEYV